MKNKGLFFTPILLSVLFSFTACQKTQTPVDTVQTLADISAFKTADLITISKPPLDCP